MNFGCGTCHWRALGIVVACSVCLGLVLLPSQAPAQESGTQIHGPFITWDTDPLTTANIVWVESGQGEGRQVAGTWKEGRAGFGFGDRDDNTKLDEMEDKFARLYIRKTFQLADAAKGERVTLHVRFDDGFIAYLNGQEVVREGVESGSGWEAYGIDNHEAEDEFDSFEIRQWDELARVGENVLAIEVHNREIDSTDLTLDPYLTSDRSPDSEPIIPRHDRWHYMADGDAPAGWTALELPPVRDEAGTQQSDVARNGTAVSPAAADPALRGVLHFRKKGTESWTRHQAIEKPFGDTHDKVYWGLLTDLEPDTEYEFVLGDVPAGEDQAPLRFRTAPAEPGDAFRFVDGGDMDSTSTSRAMTRMVAKLRPHFALIGGDIAYANGKDLRAWHRWIDAWRREAITPEGLCVPMIVAIGNHETGSDLDPEEAEDLETHHDAQFFYSLFPLVNLEPFYAVDFADYLSILVLDSDNIVPAHRQARWLQHNLAQRTDQTHIYVCYHQPVWGTAKEPATEVRKHWIPILEESAITAVFEHDHHTLKRTHRILDGKLDERGILYLGDGCWGVEPRDVPKPGEVDYLAHAASENHVWVVDLHGDHATYRAVDETGKVLDRTETDGKR